MPENQTLRIDVWSDIACPWCYLGKRRLALGFDEYRATGGTANIEVEYHSFELSPDTPIDFEGSEVDFLVAHKGLPPQQVAGMLERVTSLAAAEGLTYNFPVLRHTNTGKAHELLHLAKHEGRQEAMLERLFAAYFTQGRHLGHIDELAELAGEVGLDPGQVGAELTAGTWSGAVAADLDLAQQLGIHSVPTYVLDRQFGFSGAQSPQAFAQVLHQASGLLAPEPA